MPDLTTYFAAAQARRDAEDTDDSHKMIERADAVSIFDVLEDMFGKYVPREGGSFKSECPFGIEHPDGGMDKGWRAYPESNSSMCFVMHGYMTPVRLVQERFALGQRAAARKILAYYGLLAPRNYRERWNEVSTWKDRQGNKVGDLQNAVDALQTALRTTEGYASHRFDSSLLEALERELEKASNVQTVHDLHAWYAQARTTLVSLVGEAS